MASSDLEANTLHLVTTNLDEDRAELAEQLASYRPATAPGTPPVAVAYEVLGNVKNVGYGMAANCEIMFHGLQRSLETYEVYDDEGKDPATSVVEANQHLT